MAAPRISIRPAVSYEPIVRALAKFILVASTLFIVFAALFPFDFYFPNHGVWQQIAREFDSAPEPPLLDDRIQNLVLFMPFGFGLAATIRARRKTARTVARITGALVGGAILSLTIEVLQVFLGFRDPTWSDVIMNMLGSVAGAAIVAFGGEQLLDAIAPPLASLKPYTTFTNVTLVLIAYTLLQFAAPFLARGRGSLEDWDNGFPLLIGNEATGERPWHGTVWQVDLAARSASAEEVARIFESGTAREVLADALVGSYTTEGPGPYADRAGLLKPLTWTPQPADPPAAGPPAATEPAHVSPDRWLRTPAAIAPAIHRIRNSAQFTLVATIAPDHPDQRGPARIVSISGSTLVRNVSLMHAEHDLAIRLRTPLLGRDGLAPEALVDDVFESSGKKEIVLTYADPLLVVYVDRAERGRLEITPEAAVIWRLYPRVGWKVKLTRYGFRSYAAVYRLLVFIPFAALLSAATALSRKPLKAQALIVVGSILVTTIILELILGSLTASGFQPRNLAISLFIAFGSVAAMRLRPAPRSYGPIHRR